MKIKLIGTGACGNNATIDAINTKLMPEERVLMINSTRRDVPDEFKDKLIIPELSQGGSGRERDASKNISLSSLQNQNGVLFKAIDEFVGKDEETEQFIVVSSSEGGSGSGNAPLIANYIASVYHRHTQLFIFTGFETDVRSYQNTLELLQECTPNLTVQIISNKKFLDEANGNELKAEKLANIEFLMRLGIMMGRDMIDNTSKTMDDAELKKLVTTPGYLVIGHTDLDKIKNIEQYNKAITTMIDDNKSIDTVKSAARFGVIFSVAENTIDYLDYSYSVFKEKYGNFYESFPHVQTTDKKEYISYIVSGLKMPIDMVKETYEKYKKESEKVNKDSDDFFSQIANLKGNSVDAKFNTNLDLDKDKNADINKDKNDFFAQFSQPKSNFSNTVSNEVKDVPKDEKKSRDEFFKKNY